MRCQGYFLKIALGTRLVIKYLQWGATNISNSVIYFLCLTLNKIINHATYQGLDLYEVDWITG